MSGFQNPFRSRNQLCCTSRLNVQLKIFRLPVKLFYATISLSWWPGDLRGVWRALQSEMAKVIWPLCAPAMAIDRLSHQEQAV
jgi:hypothetical protein